MRKNILIIFAVIFTLLSCSNSLQPPTAKFSDKAYVSFSIKGNIGRTALPSNLDKEDLSFELTYQKKDSEEPSKSVWNTFQEMESSFEEKIELECGNWIFILMAKNNSKMAYISSVEKEVKPGENSILFSLEEVEDGTGTFTVTANLSIGKAEKVTAALFDIENKPVEGFEEEVLEVKNLENKVTAVYEKEDVPCGYYIVKFFVYRYADDSEYEVVKSELVRVASGNISVGEVSIDNSWNKTITLFTGTVDRTEEDYGDTTADIPMDLIRNNPDAYILVEDDMTNGRRMIMFSFKEGDDERSVWEEDWGEGLSPYVKTFAYKCSDIYNMLSEEDKLLDTIRITECGGLKLKSVKLTYDTVKVSYDGEGVDLGKTSEKLPVGMSLLAPDKHKENYLFDYWKNVAGERIDVVPEDDITLYPVWKKSEVLFTGTKDRVGETGGSDKAYISVETLKLYPGAYIIIEDDVNSGNRMIQMSNNAWDNNFYSEEWTGGHTGIEIQEFRCLDILDMMADADKEGTYIHICDWGSTKIKSITLTYDFTNITYMKDGGEIEKLSEALPKGLKINNTGRKEGVFFGGWMTEDGDEVTVVPEEDVVLYPNWLESLDMKPRMLSWGRLITKNDLERYPDATLVLNFAFNGSISGTNGAISADWDNSNSWLESWSRLDEEYEVTRKYKASYLIDFLNKRNKEHFETNMLTNAEGYEIKELYLTYSEKPDFQIDIADSSYFFSKDTKLLFKQRPTGGIEFHVNCDGEIEQHYGNADCRIFGGGWSQIPEGYVVSGYYLDAKYTEELPETLVLSEDVVIYPKFVKGVSVLAGNSGLYTDEWNDGKQEMEYVPLSENDKLCHYSFFQSDELIIEKRFSETSGIVSFSIIKKYRVDGLSDITFYPFYSVSTGSSLYFDKEFTKPIPDSEFFVIGDYVNEDGNLLIYIKTNNE